MAISLYELSVPTYLQTLGAASHFLERGLAHCREQQIDPQVIVETRVFPDMLPFRFQITSIAHHAVGAMEAVKSGVFHPATDKGNLDYGGLQALLQDAQERLRKLTAEEINAREGADVSFQLADRSLPFTAEHFVLSFSLPNFHFHAATAYNILRAKGVPLGKRDYMGRVRIKR
jgi:uncharacterized protein